MAGLASLTANYTDSEDEDPGSDNHKGESENEQGDSSGHDDDQREASAKSFAGKPSVKERSATPAVSETGSNRSTPTLRKRLVSYGVENEDEENESKNKKGADERDDKNAEPVPMELDSDEESGNQTGLSKSDRRERSELVSGQQHGVSSETEYKPETPEPLGAKVEAWTEGVSLPAEPPGKCSEDLQENINRLYRRRLNDGYDMNAVIQNKKAFRNPSIYEKLIQFCRIDEHGTNFPKELYDGHLFGPESYYDELAKVQKADMERREKAAKERAVKASEAAKRVEEATTKRKSKWDQVGPPGGSLSNVPPSVFAPGLHPPVAMQPMKVIPAFGALKKH